MAPPKQKNSSKVERRASRPRAVHKREKKRVYVEDWDDLDEADVALPRSYSLEEKLSCERFTDEAVIMLSGTEFNLEWVQRHGLSSPLLFSSTEGLGMKVPRVDFSIDDVRTCVGSRRVLDVMDVNTQKNTQMSMKQWQRYYESQAKDRLLNVISLEFSHTKLEKHVLAPTVVRQLDWVDCVWPRELKQLQTESTNALDEMMYPKVQKYCLMSVGGCFTDFHIDFGGTSVWYHVLRGKKYFWLIPPTEENIRVYEKWVLSGKQSDIFFGDLVTQCSLVCLTTGHTFFIPTGWIHAVYTPEDSLVFGGNFLHSFGIETQIRVYKMEDITKVEHKYRYPFFIEMLWYTLDRYVQCCLGISQLSLGLQELPELAEFEQLFRQQQLQQSQLVEKQLKHVHLTPYELRGIKAIVMFLHDLPQCRKNVPALISDPAALISHVRELVRGHRHDSPQLAVTGRPTLFWPDNGQAFVRLLRSHCKTASRSQSTVDTLVTESPLKPAVTDSPGKTSGVEPPAEVSSMDLPIKVSLTNPAAKVSISDVPAKPPVSDVPVKTPATSSRRVRCRKCPGCKSDKCGRCEWCLCTNKQQQQQCVNRVCIKPLLPASSVCALCSFSEQQPPPLPDNVSSLHTSTPLCLFECSQCLVVSHILCTISQNPSLGRGSVEDSCPAAWLCPACLSSCGRSSREERLSPGSEGGGGGEEGRLSHSLLSKQLGCVDVTVTLPILDLDNARAALKPTEIQAETHAATGVAEEVEITETAEAVEAETTTKAADRAEIAETAETEIADTVTAKIADTAAAEIADTTAAEIAAHEVAETTVEAEIAESQSVEIAGIAAACETTTAEAAETGTGNQQVITAEPEIPTAEPEIATFEPEITAVPEIATAEPEMTTPDQEITTNPEIPTAEPEIPTAEPEIATTDLEIPTAEPEIATAELETTAETETQTNEPEKAQIGASFEAVNEARKEANLFPASESGKASDGLGSDLSETFAKTFSSNSAVLQCFQISTEATDSTENPEECSVDSPVVLVRENPEEGSIDSAAVLVGENPEEGSVDSPVVSVRENPEEGSIDSTAVLVGENPGEGSIDSTVVLVGGNTEEGSVDSTASENVAVIWKEHALPVTCTHDRSKTYFFGPDGNCTSNSGALYHSSASLADITPHITEIHPDTAEVYPATAENSPGISPDTADASPVTVDTSPVTADTSPVTADTSPVTAYISPVTVNISHVTADISPVTADASPVTTHIYPVTAPDAADISPVTAPDTADISPNAARDVSPNTSHDVSPDTAPDISPNTAPDISPNTAYDIFPVTALNTADIEETSNVTGTSNDVTGLPICDRLIEPPSLQQSNDLSEQSRRLSENDDDRSPHQDETSVENAIYSRSPSPPVLQPNFDEEWLSGDDCPASSSSTPTLAAPQLSPMSPSTPTPHAPPLSPMSLSLAEGEFAADTRPSP